MNKSKSLPKYILLALEKSVDGYIRMEDFLYNPGSYAYGGGWQYPLKKTSLSKALKRLRENGMIDFVDDKTLTFRLTNSGKDRALWIKMKEEKSDWDGKWRLVIWDIPETRRSIRDLLRSKLKELGFTQFQKSVWGSKKNCTNILREFIKQVGIEKWVMVIESDNIGNKF